MQQITIKLSDYDNAILEGMSKSSGMDKDIVVSRLLALAVRVNMAFIEVYQGMSFGGDHEEIHRSNDG